MRKISLIICTIFCFALLSAIASADKPLEIVTTTPDLADAARNIIGSRGHVSFICQGYQDPHNVEAKPSYLKLLQNANGFIETGLSLEIAWAPSLLRGARNKVIMPGGCAFFDASSGITVLEKPNGQVDRTMGDVHPQGNPHYTLNPTNMKIVARSITAFLKSIDPQGAAVYDQNYSRYWHELDAADKRWKQILKPYAGKCIVTYHSTWPYFAQHFGIKVVEHIENQPGISPSANHLNSLVTIIKSHQVKAIVMEPWFSEKIPNALSAKTGVKVIKLPILPGGVPGTDTYIKMMDYNVNHLAEAIKQ